MAKKRTVAKTDQYAEFVGAAKSLGCDEDPAHFDAALKKVARHKPPPINDARKTSAHERQKEKK